MQEARLVTTSKTCAKSRVVRAPRSQAQYVVQHRALPRLPEF